MVVPNAPKTPHRTIRVTGELWAEAQRVAAKRGETVSDVIRRALEQYVRDDQGITATIVDVESDEPDRWNVVTDHGVGTVLRLGEDE